MRAPGALHHARFLDSSLYIMKLALLANALPPGLVTPLMQEGIDRMAQYIALFLGPWCMQARLSVCAPRLDLQVGQQMTLYEVNSCEQGYYSSSTCGSCHHGSLFFVHHHLVMSFQDIDAAIAQEVKAFLLRHPWYLSQQLIILGFCYRGVMQEEKATMAAALRIIPKQLHFYQEAAVPYWHTADSRFHIGHVCRTWLLAGIHSVGHRSRLAGLATSRMASWSALCGDGCHHGRLGSCEWHSWKVHQGHPRLCHCWPWWQSSWKLCLHHIMSNSHHFYRMRCGNNNKIWMYLCYEENVLLNKHG